ncbi:MAG: hypothetical protein DWQ35_12075 [Planctomycetota bacterium]|nr:MAG: hypothetical protein DWQ35_12075 [Planctomycetota bacterium]REK30370.1 MAG: hypothetical protein DWQ42_01800 [Planctomycetota bacterium]REK40253.1 MAG: hypothetical protein DWQ46_16845 [Planctomycetota bacterium]
MKLHEFGASLDELIKVAAAVGPEIIEATYGANPHLGFSYRRMYYILRFVRGLGRQRGMRQHCRREFQHSRDLYLRPSARIHGGDWDVLPQSIGQDSRRQGRRWSVTELTRRGREAATEDGWQNPASSVAIPYGLLEAARRNPLHARDHEIDGLIRDALFDLSEFSSDPDPELVDIVCERLLVAMHNHRDDDEETFNRWLCGSGKSVIKQIVQQKRARGGQLNRHDVIHAVLHLGWQSYQYMSGCLQAMMRCIKHAIPAEMSTYEQDLYALVYEQQPYLANMPLALISERLNFLRPAILRLWEEPCSTEFIPVLHRMLAYYGRMIDVRRRADRTSKARSSRRSRQRPAAVGSGTANAIFTDVANHIRELHGIRCANGCLDWDAWRDDDGDEIRVVLGFVCPCGKTRQLTLSVEEFQRIGRDLLLGD